VLASLLLTAPLFYLGASAIVNPDPIAARIRELRDEFRDGLQALAWHLTGELLQPAPDNTADPRIMRRIVRVGGYAFCLCALLGVIISAL
jgi:hypothetical protein